ncbi:MAG TPA: metal ABC transporter ATP-binding protein [Phycisphaeraceae bacterium]
MTTQDAQLQAPPAQQQAWPVRVEGLTVAYQAKPVLRSVSFHVQAGQVLGIIGPNGAGKSTLLKCLLGLVRPDMGVIELFGRPADQVRPRVAYVPQTEAVDWDFPVTVFDVVLMGRMAHLAWWQRPSRADRHAAAEALERVGMQDFSRRHIRQLSGGQQRRVFLARALCQGADLLLLDEPLTGVDAATEETLFALIAQMAREGRTLVIVNHDLSVLDRFDALLLLNQRVVAFGPTSQVATQENLRATYGGRLALLDQADELLRRQRIDADA